jgi:hypothetical protein
MKKYILLLLLNIHGMILTSHGQYTYKTYFKGLRNYTRESCYYINNKYYFLTGIYNPNLSRYINSEIIIDSTGSTLQPNIPSNYFFDTSIIIHTSIFSTQRDSIVFFQDGDIGGLYIQRVNVLSQSRRSVKIGGAYYETNYGLSYDQSKLFYYCWNAPQGAHHAVVFDDTLKYLHSFSLPNTSESFIGMHALDDGSYIAGINNSNTGSLIARFDSARNVLWCNKYLPNNSIIFGGTHNANNTFTYFGLEDTSGALINRNFFMFTIDEDGTLVWSKMITGTPTSFPFISAWGLAVKSYICKTVNDGFLLAFPWYNGNTTTDLLLVKLDANGDTLWAKAHGGVATSEFVYKAQETPDRGFIIKGITSGGGGTTPSVSANVYIIKTDSMGSTATQCDERYLPITVSSSVLTPVPQSLSLQSFTPILSSLPMLVNGQLPAPAAYDACVLTPQGIQNKEAVVSIAIYPNPSTGIFNLEFEDATVKEIEVYTMQGRSVYKARVNSQTTSINLAHLSAGLYYVQATTAQGTGTVKLVKE